MAASFITGLVIKHNNELYLDTDLVSYGDIQVIPTPGSGGRPDGDFWADPISDFGVVTGMDFIANTGGAAPSAQAFSVFRLITSGAHGKADVWYVRGSVADYIEASADAECCASPAKTLTLTAPKLAPCYKMCRWDATSKYFARFGVPIPQGFGYRYYAYGYYNGAPLAALSGYGYLTLASLVSAMQSSWGSTTGGTFAAAADNRTITLTQNSGSGDDVLCINIFFAPASS